MSASTDGRRLKGRATRRRILEAAMELIARDGVSGLTASALAQEAGISKATVFHHFERLELVPVALLDHIIEELDEVAQHHDDARAYLLQSGHDVLQLTARGALESRVMNALLLASQHNAEIAQRLSVLSRMYRDHMAARLQRLCPQLSSPERAEEVADIAVAAVDGLAIHMVLTGESERLQKAWTALVDGLVHMLGPQLRSEDDDQ